MIYNLKKITESLLDSVVEAGEIAKEISQRGVKITIKHDKSPVTDGDIEVDQILTSNIKKLTPDIPIISEETVDLRVENKWKTFWLIDPIDGTKEYIKKRDEYTLNAALIMNLQPVAGVVYAPKKDRLFFAYSEKNSTNEIKKYSYETTKKRNNTKRLNCQKKNRSEIIGLTNSDNTPDEVLKIYKDHEVSKTIKMSSSLKFCVIAAGEADIYAAQARAFEWDIAAGHAILEHAGGFIGTINEKSFLYGKKDYKNLAIIVKREKNLQK